MDKGMASKNISYARTILVIFGILLMLISMFPGLPWAEFDRTSGIGPADYRLKVNFNAVGFDYRIDITSGGSGGIIGGMGANTTIKDEKTYPEVRGEFLDNVGLLYDSYREKSFQYELKMRSPPEESDITWNEAGNPASYLNVSMESDLIPWWPETGKRDLDVKIDLTKIDLLDQVSSEERDRFSITINKVRLKAFVGYNKEKGDYEGGEIELASKDVSLSMNEVGDIERVTFSIEYPEGEDAIGLFAEIEGNMTDFWGRPQLSPLPGKANPINVYPMSNGKLILGFGIPLALPLMLVSIILLAVFIIMGIVKKRFRTGLAAPAAVLSTMAPIWFIMGMNAAVDLLGERLDGAEEGLSWGPGLFFSSAAALLLITSLVMTILLNRKKEKPHFTKVEDEPAQKIAEEPSSQASFKKVEKPISDANFKKVDNGIPPPPGRPGA